MYDAIPEGHSPLGASGAERWMNCAGSVALIKQLALPESDEVDYRDEGTAAHDLAAECLQTGVDAWEFAGTKREKGIEATPEMVENVQEYVDFCRAFMTDREGRQVGKTFIERRVHQPEFHKDFYGTVDFAALAFEEEVGGIVLDVNDFKYGIGVVVEVEWNPQTMYYAYGILIDHPEVVKVRMRICQPRAFHPDGSVREFEIDADTLRRWATGTLRPAMVRTETETDFDAGSWCRFCPAKLVCPVLTSLFKAACTADPKKVVEEDNAALGRAYQYIAPVKSYLKALEDEAFRRRSLGQDVPGTKLVHKKANRVFKPGAIEVLTEQLGPEAVLSAPTAKSPAQIEALGAKEKALVREWAYTPESGLTLALDSDKRAEVIVRTGTDTFGDAVNNLEDEQ